ncbi:MBL fold metallo-hydrolase [Paenibacillus sp. FSL K6-2859]|uniref:MBL fold metallo-hydrolase n=1 Tax=Paenibacillus sp. FSL K6-2859 TaxID=2921482 RepID=UPI0030F7CC18
MEFMYLGTGASEGYPALFCQCERCSMAMELGGKNIRARTGALINSDLLLDFSPDMYMNKLRYKLDLGQVNHLIVTHSHTDHFAAAELMMRHEHWYCQLQESGKKLHIYGNETVEETMKSALRYDYGTDTIEDPFYEFHIIQPFMPFTLGEVTVTALPAHHKPDEHCFIYLLEQNNTRFLYGNDSGVFNDVTFNYLRDKHLDVVSLDCNYGLEDRYDYHMGISGCRIVREKLFDQNSCDTSTSFILTHFSHYSAELHDTLVKNTAEENFIISYDGMKVFLA